MAIIGIDLGTTNSLVTTYRKGHQVLIPNRHGDLMTPSVVGLDEKEQLIVGKIAKERLVSAPELTTSLFKRNMGTAKKVSLGTKVFTPEELSSFVLRQLIADAESFLGEPVEEAIISVPAYFTAKQRAATKRAGQLAGVKVERLINEPSAAALSCREEGLDETFIVFDFGGGTLDVSIVETFDNIINICAISGNNFLGGRDFDNVIAQALVEENDSPENQLSKQDYEILMRVAEKAKIELGKKREVTISTMVGNQKIQMKLTNEKLAELAKGILAKLRKPIQQVMQDTDFTANDIDKCILVGGSCHMPVVQNYLTNLLSIPVINSGNIDETVAHGLATYVGIKQRASGVKDLLLTDICPYTLSNSVNNQNDPSKPLAFPMIARNSMLPISVTKHFYTIEPGQTVVSFDICQGEELYAADNDLLGNLRIEVPKNLLDHEECQLTFTYDINAILVVKVVVTSTKKEYVLVLTGDGLQMTDKDAEDYLKNVAGLDLRIIDDERQLLLLERAKAIYTQGDEMIREHIKYLMPFIERRSGSLRKMNATLDEIEEVLADIEENQLGTSDIFSDNKSRFSLLDEEGEIDDEILEEDDIFGGIQ